MVIAIRNETGIDLYLAISASEKSIRFRVTQDAPVLAEDEHAERLRAGRGFGMTGCPERVGVKVDVSRAGLAIRAARRREMIDRIDDFGQLDGEETYMEFTLRLLN